MYWDGWWVKKNRFVHVERGIRKGRVRGGLGEVLELFRIFVRESPAGLLPRRIFSILLVGRGTQGRPECSGLFSLSSVNSFALLELYLNNLKTPPPPSSES